MLVACIVAACADAPVQTMSDTRQAISAAEVAGAVTLAPVPLETARERLKKAEALLRLGEYRAAHDEATAARHSAAEALAASQQSTFQH